MRAVLITADRWLRYIDLTLISMAGAAVMTMMGVTFVDVFLRYVLNKPLSWSFDLITQYLLVGSFFFAFSTALRANENVAVDFISRKLSVRTYSIMMSVGHILTALIFAFVVWLSANDAHDAWVNNEAFVGALVWPTWLAKCIIPIGAMALTLRLVHRSLAYGLACNDPDLQKTLNLEQNRPLENREPA